MKCALAELVTVEKPDYTPCVPVLYAHRGASSECPENTLSAFRRAMEVGAHALEFDIHMTSDGHIVVSHDASGRRMCGVDRQIRRTTLRDVKTWDAGHEFTDKDGKHSFRDREERIPTLEEVLDEFAGVPMNVDIKQPYPNMVSQTLGILRRHGAQERVTLASFRWRTLMEVRLRGYEGPTSLSQLECIALLAAGPGFRALPKRGNAAQLPTNVGPMIIGQKTIDHCHRLGLRVDFWTVNDVAEARELLAMGADGIMSDDPREVAAAF